SACGLDWRGGWGCGDLPSRRSRLEVFRSVDVPSPDFQGPWHSLSGLRNGRPRLIDTFSPRRLANS
ncbi:MAG: hypothetical protein QGG40_14490, partial [Myxococcota bacterium]|nr:hypothetical protein [Myxococcota bacterium]